VAARVVHLLEVVQVEHDQADGAAAPERAVQLRVEPLLETAPVQAPGERIGARYARQRLPPAVLVAGVPPAQHGRAREAQREEPDVLGVRPRAGHSDRHIGDVVQRPDRDHRLERVGKRREDDGDEEQQRERAGRAAVGSDDHGGERDLCRAPQQEEGLPPAAAHDALVRHQHEHQRHDGSDPEQRGDQLALRPVPGRKHVDPAGGTRDQGQTHPRADALGARAQLGEVDSRRLASFCHTNVSAALEAALGFA
jgi:hypothetical protein